MPFLRIFVFGGGANSEACLLSRSPLFFISLSSQVSSIKLCVISASIAGSLSDFG